ncbi:MAG: fasciclin domain-containing protein [Ilumatobacteraceae bacterium]|nr:fasciclin domain-containing protein [Ilumatobacteraceae bacterium]
MNSRTTRITALAAVAALGLAACGDDGNDADTISTPAAAESTADSGETTGEEVGTIVDVAASIDDFSTLVAAVQAAGLVETLSSEGPFTVFAPTNEAFATALDSLGITADELLADTDTLTEILTYHVLSGAVDAETAISLDGQTAETVNGAEISINVVDGNVVINDATVTTADVMASNGIIHVIDTVLLPPHDGMTEEMSDEMSDDMSEEMSDDMSEESMGSIVDVAVEAGSFTTLVAAVQAAGLEETLATGGPFTVFAPTDEAFAAALEALGLTAEELLADTETLTSILTYHVIDGEVPASTVVTLDGESAETLNGASVDISVDGETVMVNDATVVAVDVAADNGIIHVIDSVLLPPSN